MDAEDEAPIRVAVQCVLQMEDNVMKVKEDFTDSPEYLRVANFIPVREGRQFLKVCGAMCAKDGGQ